MGTFNDLTLAAEPPKETQEMSSEMLTVVDDMAGFRVNAGKRLTNANAHRWFPLVPSSLQLNPLKTDMVATTTGTSIELWVQGKFRAKVCI